MSNEALEVRNTLEMKDEQKWSIRMDQSLKTLKYLIAKSGKSIDVVRNMLGATE